MRLFYATDVHGSERCFRKFLNAAEFYGADAVLLGGDITGQIRPGRLTLVGSLMAQQNFLVPDGEQIILAQ